MDSVIWSWALNTFLDILSSIFNFAVDMFGVAVTSILVLIFVSAIARLIIRPLLGRTSEVHSLRSYGDSKPQN